MSTKIYNGFKFKSSNIATIQKNLLKLKDPAIVIAASLMNQHSTVNDFINGIRSSNIERIKDIKENLTISTPKYKLWEIFKEFYMYEFIPYYLPNIEFRIHIYAYKNNEIYGVWTGDYKYCEILKPYIINFYYQNQSDKPDYISDKDWKYRAKVWNSMINWSLSDTSILREIIVMNRIEYIDVNNNIKKAFFNILESLGYNK